MMASSPYPTSADVDEWDFPSLFVATGGRALERAHLHGFDSLNDAERILGCLFQFDGDVNNGGFGLWLGNNDPKCLRATAPALHAIGATAMASFIEVIQSKLQALAHIDSEDEWQQYFEQLPDEYHEEIELLTRPFLELEPAFLDSAYSFARMYWAQVRAV
jgi:hypothetical protein